MFNITTTMLLSAAAGSAWKADGMKGYLAVVGKLEAGTTANTFKIGATDNVSTIGSSTHSATPGVGDVLVAFQQKDGDCYLFLLKAESKLLTGGDKQSNGVTASKIIQYYAGDTTNGTAPTHLSDTRIDGSASSGSAKLLLTAELFGYLLDGTWTRGTIDAYEAYNAATSSQEW